MLKLRRYLLILSAPRSGAEALAATLASHPQAVSLGQADRLSDAVKKKQTCTCGAIPLGSCEFWSAVGANVGKRTKVNPVTHPWDYPMWPSELGRVASTRIKALESVTRSTVGTPAGAASLAAYALDPGVRTIRTNALHLLDAALDESNTEVAIDQVDSPWRGYAMYNRRPNAGRFVHVVRDGRGVMSAMLRLGERKDRRWFDDPSKAAKEWVHHNADILNMLHHVDPQHWITVRYEDLVTDPEREVARIHALAELPPIQTANVASGHAIDVDRTAKGKFERDERWRVRATPAELAAFTRVGGKMNVRLGYPVS